MEAVKLQDWVWLYHRWYKDAGARLAEELQGELDRLASLGEGR